MTGPHGMPRLRPRCPPSRPALRGPSWAWPVVRTAWSKRSAKLSALGARGQRALQCSRFRDKRARGGQAPGP